MKLNTRSIIKLCLTGIIVIGLIAVSGCTDSKSITKKSVSERFSEFEKVFNEKKSQNYNTSVSEKLAMNAKQAYDAGNYESADALINDAYNALEISNAYNASEISKVPVKSVEGRSLKNIVTTSGNLDNIKVVTVYERIIGLKKLQVPRPVDESVDLILKGETDFVFRGFFKMDSTWGYGVDTTLYVQLEDAISQLKARKPTIIFQGGLSASILDPADTWADGTPLSDNDINDMILYIDGKSIKRDRPWLPKGYDHIADIASPKYRDFIVGWSEKLIDSGVDSILYDEVLIAPVYKTRNTKDFEELMTTYEEIYWKDIVERVKDYAKSQNKTVYLTANENYNLAILFHPLKYTDMATFHFARCDMPPLNDRSEQKSQFCDLENWQILEDWDLLKEKVKESHNGSLVPIVVFIDWGGDANAQLGLFVKMDPEDQNRFLELVDNETSKNGILFAYPMHGGEPGIQKKASQFNGVYDSVEYGTYDTIAKIAALRQSK